MMSSLVWTYFRTIFVIIQESKSTDRIYQTYMGGIYRECKMDIQMWSRAQGPGTMWAQGAQGRPPSPPTTFPKPRQNQEGPAQDPGPPPPPHTPPSSPGRNQECPGLNPWPLPTHHTGSLQVQQHFKHWLFNTMCNSISN